MKINQRIIIIDADVVSHFITADEHSYIHLIFPKNQIFILDKVHYELQNWPNKLLLEKVSDLLSSKKIKLMPFPEDDELVKKEYYYLKSKLYKGDGESACLAVARYNKNILASSNLKGIKQYCNMHKIDYLTTMDFLCVALKLKLFTKERCNIFIKRVIKNGSKLPVKFMKDFECKNINFL